MRKQKEKRREKVEAILRFIFSIIGLFVCLLIMKVVFFGMVNGIIEYGVAIMMTYFTGPAWIIAIGLLGTLLCMGFIYDFLSHPHHMKNVKKIFQEEERIPVKITKIAKKNPRKDCDIYQAYRVEWEFIQKKIPYLPMHTIIYTDEPEFMYAYRTKEAYLTYDPSYYEQYKLNFIEEKDKEKSC